MEKNNRFYYFLCYKKVMKSNLSISSIAHETKLLVEKAKRTLYENKFDRNLFFL